jgi:hypothetical protein
MSEDAITCPRPNFYTVGGTLKATAPSYVPRLADRQLLQAVQQRQFCYVLTPRQMGKSSLMVRTASRLNEKGIDSVIVDLSGIGTTDISAESWYLGQVKRISEQLALRVNYTDWWNRQGKLGVVQRFTSFLTDVVLKNTVVPLVIFVDEIDTTLTLRFNSDDYFAAIRALNNERPFNQKLERLTFVLLGVASPSDLIKDGTRTPFNIGTRVHLTDFTATEAQPLMAGLAPSPDLAAQLLGQVLFWTGGHPYLTQKTCARVAQWCESTWSPSEVPIIVDELIREMFLTEAGQSTDDNLRFIRDRVLESSQAVKLLQIYRDIRQGEILSDNELDLTLATLKLTGLIKAMDGVLKVRNPIYERVFDESWVRQALSERELRITPKKFKYDVFISYSHTDEDWVRGYLLPSLERSGCRVSIDYREFRPGISIALELERAIEESLYTLLVLTPAWVASNWIEVERLLISTKDPDGRRRQLIPLMRKPTELPLRISGLTYLDFTQRDRWEEQMPRLLRLLGVSVHIESTGEAVQPFEVPSLDYNTGAIRQLLTEVFSADEDLDAFAYDNFRAVYERLTTDISKGKKIHMLIEYAEKNKLLDRMLDQVARLNPRQYRRFAHQIKA